MKKSQEREIKEIKERMDAARKLGDIRLQSLYKQKLENFEKKIRNKTLTRY